MGNKTKGINVWEIEMNGGDNTECATCPDYTYQDQVDYFWPVLIAGVMNYSGKNQVHYIGHSNGCRVALSSLNSYSNGKNSAGYTFSTSTGLYDTLVDLPTHPVDKFFGVACPAVLNDGTALINTARYTGLYQNQPPAGNLAMRNINNSNLKHITFSNYATPLAQYAPSLILDFQRLKNFNNDNKVSRSLMQFYNDLALSTNSQFQVSNVNVNELHLYNGIYIIFGGDGLVPASDQTYILNATGSFVKDGTNIWFSTHDGLKDDSKIYIKEVLNK